VVTHTNSAHFVFVALDEAGTATAVPQIELETDDERARFAEARERQVRRLAQAKKAKG
jgi:acyl-CoA hydrolase